MNDLTINVEGGPIGHFIKSWGTNVSGSSGVPCGVLRHFIHALGQMPVHIPGLNEREAVGIAAGMWLAGKRPLLYMQNSGMLVASNDIGSLLIPCQMEIPFLVTYRGAPGENATQHLATGAATEPLLNAYGMWHACLTEQNAGTVYEECLQSMQKTQKPGVILVKRGWTQQKGVHHQLKCAPVSASHGHGTILDYTVPGASALRDDILSAIHGATPPDVGLVSSTGLISRSLFARHHTPNQFYNAGGFGLTSAIGLGFAVSRPEKRVVVVEGDASCLTNFGNFVTIGHHQPSNMTHIILDNGAYGSCSEERSLSGSAHIPETAARMGYNVYMANTTDGVSQALHSAHAYQELTLIYVQTSLGGPREFARPLSMAQNAREFKTHMR